MRVHDAIVIRIPRRLVSLLAIAAFAASMLGFIAGTAHAQKAQESYDAKFNIADRNAGVGIAASSDGKYVYVVGPQGILVSDDFGKTGTWVQTVKLK